MFEATEPLYYRRRSRSAPCCRLALSCVGPDEMCGEGDNGLVDPNDGWRGTAAYAAWYYSQCPCDPRLPPPVATSDSWLPMISLQERREQLLSAERGDGTLRVLSLFAEEDGLSPRPPHDAGASPLSSRCSVSPSYATPTLLRCSEKSACAWATSPTHQQHIGGPATAAAIASKERQDGGKKQSSPLRPGAKPYIPSPAATAAAAAAVAAREVPPSQAPPAAPTLPPPPQVPPAPATPCHSGASSTASQPDREPQQRRHSSTSGHTSQSSRAPPSPGGQPVWTLRSMRGSLRTFATEQEGSRVLQRAVETCTPTERDGVYEELLPAVLDLATDVAGNYVVQKLLEHGSQRAIRGLVTALRADALRLSMDPYGCRVMQRCLDASTEEERISLLKQLEPNMPQLVEDLNGNHVVQKCIEVIPSACRVIVGAFTGKVGDLATHGYGCRVVQRLLEHCRERAEIVPILEEVLKRVHALVSDQYGNYVVQHVVVNGHPQYRFAVTTRLRGHFALLSSHKHASNVVEKMYEYATPQLRDAIIEELMRPHRQHQDSQGEVLSGALYAATDQYGNYVMQKLFEVCDENQRETLARHLTPSIDRIRRAPFGKHFAARLERHDQERKERESRMVQQPVKRRTSWTTAPLQVSAPPPQPMPQPQPQTVRCVLMPQHATQQVAYHPETVLVPAPKEAVTPVIVTAPPDTVPVLVQAPTCASAAGTTYSGACDTGSYQHPCGVAQVPTLIAPRYLMV